MRWWEKFLTLVALTLVVILSTQSPIPSAEKLVQPSPSDDVEKLQQRSAATNAPAYADPSKAQETELAANRERHNAKDRLSRYDFWSLLAQYLIFAATLIYACVAISQLYAIHRQADLAQKTLTMLGMAERAWVAFDLENIDGFSDLLSHRSPQRVRSLGITIVGLTANYSLINCGKTPAHVDFGGVLMRFVADIDELPQEPDYRGIGEIPVIMPPGRPVNGRTPIVLLYEHVQSLLNNPKSAIMVYGAVRYRDVLSEASHAPHESRFCYLAQFPPEREGFMVKVGGPKSYNHYT